MNTEKQLPHIPGPVPSEPYRTLIRYFMSNLFQNGTAVSTIVSYGWQLHKLGIWLTERGISDPAQVSPTIILEWGEFLRLKYAAQTHKQAVVAARSFFRFLADIHVCPNNVAEDVRKFLATPKTKVTLQRTLTQSEVDALFSVCQSDQHDIRNLAIMALLLDTGLRASELCAISLQDIDYKNRRIQVVGKGGNQEFVYYSRKCQEVLEKWLDIRRSMSAPCDKLFVSLGGISRGEPLTPRGLRIIMKRLGEHAGVKGVHPHAFRRTFATLRIKKGQSTRGVQRLGRWRNLATFERYTHALLTDDEFAKNEANSYSPLP